MGGPKTYRNLPDLELGPELDAKVRATTDQAEHDVEATRINFRWGKAQLATVKRAAALHGVPYQTYAKQVLIKQAIQDIRAAEEIVATHRGATTATASGGDRVKEGGARRSPEDKAR